MKTEKNIFIAFILNLAFSIFEFFGGIYTNSVAILSDSIHDLGDSLSIGVSYFLEKKSKGEPNKEYTYGYLRYSILGAFITTIILTIGSIFVIIESIQRIMHPVEINYNGMIVFAVIGLLINFTAAFKTKDGKSLNQRAVSLHMLEDVLGWFVVLIGSVLMKFTNIEYIDPIMSIGVALFILYNTLTNIKEITDIFFEKTPKNINIDEVKKQLEEIDGVEDVHHIHIWSMDNINNYATMHIILNKENEVEIKNKIREKLKESDIHHVTIEIEKKGEKCEHKNCEIKHNDTHHHHHHH